ncbi:MAG: glycosyltransferase [Marinobacter sp.]|uniref:glycosyltransferase n=1 Tax=Marinobacter sp. TaxID=50741 RepID=UPI00329A0109
MVNLPFVSVLVPAFNEEEFINECLLQLRNQDYPSSSYEIIVMDNGSKDSTVDICKSHGVNVIDASGRLIGGVRNLGAKHAQGEVLAYIDADCIASTDWISNGVTTLLSDKSLGALGGGFGVRADASWVEKAWVISEFDDDFISSDILATGSFFIKKEIFIKVGGFNEKIKAGEDTEISRSLLKHGFSLALTKSVNVIHLGYPRTLGKFFIRQFWQSSDYLRTRKKGFDAVFSVTLIFIFLFFMALASLLLGTYFYILFFIGGISCSSVLAVYRFKKSRHRLDVFLFLKVFFLNYLYLVARSGGLLRSIFSELKSFFVQRL